MLSGKKGFLIKRKQENLLYFKPLLLALSPTKQISVQILQELSLIKENKQCIFRIIL